MHKRNCFKYKSGNSGNDLNKTNEKTNSQTDLKMPSGKEKLVVTITENMEVEPVDTCKVIAQNANIYLNYTDVSLAQPIKDFLTDEVKKAYSDGCPFDGEETFINIVSSDYDVKCRENFDMAVEVGSRIINIIFGENKESCFEKYECLYVPESDIDEYLLSSILKNYNFIMPNKTKQVINNLQDLLSNSLSIHCNEKTAIVMCGSFGFTLLNDLKKGILQGSVKMNGVFPAFYLLLKNQQVNIGQPSLHCLSGFLEENICLNLSDDKPIRYDSLKKTISDFLEAVIQKGCSRILLVGALGKTASSIAIPFIASEAQKAQLKTTSICIMPFSFETTKTQKMAKNAYEVIKKLSNNTYVYNPMGKEMAETDISLGEHQSYLTYAILKVFKKIFEEEDTTEKKEQQIKIEMKQ